VQNKVSGTAAYSARTSIFLQMGFGHIIIYAHVCTQEPLAPPAICHGQVELSAHAHTPKHRLFSNGSREAATLTQGEKTSAHKLTRKLTQGAHASPQPHNVFADSSSHFLLVQALQHHPMSGLLSTPECILLRPAPGARLALFRRQIGRVGHPSAAACRPCVLGLWPGLQPKLCPQLRSAMLVYSPTYSLADLSHDTSAYNACTQHTH